MCVCVCVCVCRGGGGALVQRSYLYMEGAVMGIISTFDGQ